MMTKRGHEVYLYAGDENEAECTELITLVKPENDPVNIPEFSAASPEFLDFNLRCIEEIRPRIQPRDFICIIGGSAQQVIATAFPNHMSVEYGIGYSGTFALYRVFESYAWMHTVYGAHAGNAHDADGFFFDEVIPNYFDVSEFDFVAEPQEYLVYLGRLIDRKGWQLAVEIAEQAGKQLLIAGAGDPGDLPAHCDYVGVVEPKARSILLGNALATIVPSLYLEPFGGVHVESMLCGTPVITTDWGVFTETVTPEVGRRCRMLREFTKAVNEVRHLDRAYIRDYAVSRFSTEAVAPMYEAYFERLLTLLDKGFYQ